jgi:ATP-dependent phosphoenolpyruvate carboxykinase
MASGALAMLVGAMTGRTPNDKHIGYEATTEAVI